MYIILTTLVKGRQIEHRSMSKTITQEMKDRCKEGIISIIDGSNGYIFNAENYSWSPLGDYDSSIGVQIENPMSVTLVDVSALNELKKGMFLEEEISSELYAQLFSKLEDEVNNGDDYLTLELSWAGDVYRLTLEADTEEDNGHEYLNDCIFISIEKDSPGHPMTLDQYEKTVSACIFQEVSDPVKKMLSLNVYAVIQDLSSKKTESGEIDNPFGLKSIQQYWEEGIDTTQAIEELTNPYIGLLNEQCQSM